MHTRSYMAKKSGFSCRNLSVSLNPPTQLQKVGVLFAQSLVVYQVPADIQVAYLHVCLHVSIHLRRPILSWFWLRLLNFNLIFFLSALYFLTLLLHLSVPVSLFPSFSLSVSPSLIPFINDQDPGHENQTFTMTTTISGMSQRLLCSVCVRACMCARVRAWTCVCECV